MSLASPAASANAIFVGGKLVHVLQTLHAAGTLKSASCIEQASMAGARASSRGGASDGPARRSMYTLDAFRRVGHADAGAAGF